MDHVLTEAKVIVLKLCQFKTQWDESVPIDVNVLGMDYQLQLGKSGTLFVLTKITDYIDSEVIELHGFCDVCRGHVRYNSMCKSWSVYLLCSKSKVLPLIVSPVSVSRLELSGALILSKVLTKVEKSWLISVKSCCGLAWISSTPSKTFNAKSQRDATKH